MENIKFFKNLADAKAQGNTGLCSPHVDSISGYEVVNYYWPLEDTFMCDFDFEGNLVIPSENYISFSANSAQSVKLSYSTAPTLQYSYNRGSWIDWDCSELEFGTELKPIIYFRGSNTTLNGCVFQFTNQTSLVTVGGNIMSLLDYENPSSAITTTDCFVTLFSSCTAIYEVESNFLPATSLANNCYAGLFLGCTSLTKVPNLPATGLAMACYWCMFNGCTGLISVPSNLLQATTLAVYCYGAMFEDCTSLTSAPELPATALAQNCYNTMFRGCTSLTNAPELPATTLPGYCYQAMFCNCTSLNYIKCDATDITAQRCTNSWVDNVASTGDFYGKSAAGWTSGTEGIPDGWTQHLE